jgi:hypothetical protein
MNEIHMACTYPASEVTHDAIRLQIKLLASDLVRVLEERSVRELLLNLLHCLAVDLVESTRAEGIISHDIERSPESHESADSRGLPGGVFGGVKHDALDNVADLLRIQSVISGVQDVIHHDSAENFKQCFTSGVVGVNPWQVFKVVVYASAKGNWCCDNEF